tara:strand:+ start:1933 stop:2442 length:510 start_codon:yes stop_codon:yes gene_type:complete
MMQLVINTQYMENYSDDPKSPYLKFKGGTTYVIKSVGDDLTRNEIATLLAQVRPFVTYTLEDTNGGCEAYISSHDYCSHGAKICESWESPVQLYNDKGVWKAMKITDNRPDEDGYGGWMRKEILEKTETWTCDNADNRKDYKAEYLMEDGDSCDGEDELRAWFDNKEAA